MKTALRQAVRRLGKILGLGALGAGALSVAPSQQVFAHQFLHAAMPLPDARMEYNPDLQMMVIPGSRDPLFRYGDRLPSGAANGEYRVAPLVPKTDPPPPPPPLPTVTPGGGPNGPGPHADD